MGWGQGRCERRIEVFVKIQKKKNLFFLGGGSGGGRVGGEGEVRVCERKTENFVKIQKKKLGGGPGGVRVDVNKELKFL